MVQCTHLDVHMTMQHRYEEGALESNAEERSKIQLHDAFKEIKEKAQQVVAQRRKADVFVSTYGTWWQSISVHQHHVIESCGL